MGFINSLHGYRDCVRKSMAWGQFIAVMGAVAKLKIGAFENSRLMWPEAGWIIPIPGKETIRGSLNVSVKDSEPACELRIDDALPDVLVWVRGTSLRLRKYLCLSGNSLCACGLQRYNSRRGERFDSASGRSEEHTSELQSPYDLVCR